MSYSGREGSRPGSPGGRFCGPAAAASRRLVPGDHGRAPCVARGCSQRRRAVCAQALPGGRAPQVQRASDGPKARLRRPRASLRSGAAGAWYRTLKSPSMSRRALRKGGCVCGPRDLVLSWRTSALNSARARTHSSARPPRQRAAQLEPAAGSAGPRSQRPGSGREGARGAVVGLRSPSSSRPPERASSGRLPRHLPSCEGACRLALRRC